MAAPIGNKYALGNTGGRPPMFESPEELLTLVSEYFNTDGKHTITGLTLFLGFESRSSLDAYCDKNEVFKYILKRAKLTVENSYERSGQAFDIFALKNMGWKDKTETEHSGKMQIEQITGMEVK
jgi:hypothetical protein